MVFDIQTRERAEHRGVPIIREKSHEKLFEIVSKLKPKKILEIGTAVGYSGMLMLSASPEAEIITIEHDNDKVIEARENFKNAGFENRATVIEGDCLEELAMLVTDEKYNNYFDFCFIDGPKAQYLNIYNAIEFLMQKQATIVADNVLFRGFVIDKTNMPRRFKTIVKRLKMFLEHIETDPNIDSYKLEEIEDGILIIKLK